MKSPFKNPAVLGLFFLLLCAAGIWVAAFLLDPGINKPGESKAPKPTNPAPEVTQPVESQSAPAPEAPTPVPEAAQPPEATQAPGDVDQISAIIANPNLDFPSVVNRLLEILPGLAEDEQDQAAHHIANLSDEKSVARWSAMLIANQLPAPAATVLFNDLLNRPQEINMPVLASIADLPSNPKNKDSIEILETLYGPPPQGTTWSAWVKSKTQK